MKSCNSKLTRSIVGAGVCVAVLAHSGMLIGGSVISTFDTDTEGWVVADFPDYGPFNAPLATYPGNTLYSSTGGNPGGYLIGSDPSGNNFFLQAPAKFLGDKSSAYGTDFKFDLNFQEAVDWDGGGVDLVLAGAGLTLVRGGVITPTPSWQTFQVSLSETGWHIDGPGGANPTAAQFKSLLADLTALEIRGEYHYGSDTPGLDNVSLVPEPTAFGLVAGVALTGFALWRRRCA